MADSPINGFGTTATDVPAGSYFGFDYWNGVAFETVKITQADLAAELGAANMANANLTLAANRNHDANSFRWTLGKLKDCTLEAFIAPTGGLASINLNGYGSTAGDLTHRLNTGAGAALDIYGDRTVFVRRYLGVGSTLGLGYAAEIDGTVNGVRGLFAQSSGLIAIKGVDNSNVAVFGESSGGLAIYGLSTGGGYAGYFNGKMYATNLPTSAGGAGDIYVYNDGTRKYLCIS